MKLNAIIEQNIKAMPICSDGKDKLTKLVESIIEHLPEPKLTKSQKEAIAKAKGPRYPAGSVIQIAFTDCLITKKGNIRLDTKDPEEGTMTFKEIQDDTEDFDTVQPNIDAWLLKNPKPMAYVLKLNELIKKQSK